MLVTKILVKKVVEKKKAIFKIVPCAKSSAKSLFDFSAVISTPTLKCLKKGKRKKKVSSAQKKQERRVCGNEAEIIFEDCAGSLFAYAFQARKKIRTRSEITFRNLL